MCIPEHLKEFGLAIKIRSFDRATAKSLVVYVIGFPLFKLHANAFGAVEQA